MPAVDVVTDIVRFTAFHGNKVLKMFHVEQFDHRNLDQSRLPTE